MLAVANEHMQAFGRVHALWMSFYSPDIYREGARSWAGIGVLYLMLLLSLSWVPTSIRWFVQLRDFSATTAPRIVSQLPVISIRGGVMSARPSGRHVVRDTDSSGEVILIVDDSIDALPSDAVDADVVVLTRREVGVFRKSTGEHRTWKLTPAADMEVTPDGVGAFLTSLPFWIPFVGYLACLVGSLVGRTLQILVYGAIGQAMARKWNIDLDYAGLLRIAAIAVTPVVVLRTVVGPWEPAWYLRWPVAAAITLAYLAFGIRSAAADRAG